MKNRNGFVSNSSSSSFVIDKKFISAYQMDQILDHIEEGKKFGWDWAESYDAWAIDDLGEVIRGSTIMDNFCMETFLEKIGVPTDKIEWDY